MCKWWTTLRWEDIEKMYRRFKAEISYAVSPFLHRTILYVSHLERLCFWDDEADLNLCRFVTVSVARKHFALDVPRFIMQLQLRLCLVESEISHAVVSNQKNHFSRRSGMLLVSHLGRHSMVHSHGFNIDDPVSNLINTRIRPFYVCSKPCSTSTAPNVPVVGGTFRWNSGVRGSPNWFFSLKARRRPQHVPRIPIPEGST